MDTSKAQNKEKLGQSNIDSLFTQIIEHINVDHLLITTDTAPIETKEFYSALMANDADSILSKSREDSSMYFISKIVMEYIKELKSKGKIPLKLAMGLSNSKLLVWSEIEDNDDDMENALLIAEAKVNGKYQKDGFYINSTIVEKSDNLSIPNHYQILETFG